MRRIASSVLNRLVSWILIGSFALSACASEAPVPIESDSETSEAERLPELLSTFTPGERIEVWAKSGECFEATFVSYEASTLSVEKKSYERGYQRDDHHHRAQNKYGIDEIARIREAPAPERILFPQLTPVGVVAVAAITAAAVGLILFALSFKGVGF